METTICIGIMENRMETTCLGYGASAKCAAVPRFRVRGLGLLNQMFLAAVPVTGCACPIHWPG